MPDFVTVIKVNIPEEEDLLGLPEIRRPILGILESLDRGIIGRGEYSSLFFVKNSI